MRYVSRVDLAESFKAISKGFCLVAGLAVTSLASEAHAQDAMRWASSGSGLKGYDATQGKRICRTVSEKNGSLVLGAAYNGTCHYYHYAEALKSRKFEYLLPPTGGAINWAYPGPTLTSSGLKPIKTGDWNWACSPDRKNIGYVWRDKSGTNKCYFVNGSNGAPEGSKSYRILAFGTASKNGPFSCQSPVIRQADGCSVPKNFKEADFEVPDEVPGFLVDIAEAGMDGFFDDDDYNKFRDDCNEHDICYRAPWFLGKGGRADCEREFESDLQATCDYVHDDGSPNWAICKITAAAMAAAVKDHGQSRFDNGQNWSKDNCVYPYVQ